MSDKKTFDYVIIGAGSAGCVLAARLSEDPNVKVVLLEAGGKNNGITVKMPAGVGAMLTEKNDHNWGFETVPQKHCNNRKMYWPRGRGLGGSSAINGMIYIRGHALDYEQWRQMGLSGWGYSDLLPYFKRSENFDQGANDFHGTGGPLSVEAAPMTDEIYEAAHASALQAGYQETDDFNGAEQEGFGPYSRTIRDGVRSSTNEAYLQPALSARDNITVITNAYTTRLLLENGRCIGVEYASKRGAEAESVYANSEVLVCGGAVHSPLILQHSGIGDPQKLKEAGIEVKIDSPDCGANLQDHLDVVVNVEVTQPVSVYKYAGNFFSRIWMGVNYMLFRQGPGRDNFLQHGAFLKSREGLSHPDLQLHTVNGLMINHGKDRMNAHGATLHGCQLRPESRGEVRAGSHDPFEDPLIDPNYLATEEDRRAMRECLKICREVFAQSAFDELRGAELNPGPDVKTDDEIDAYIRETAETIYHPVGTCRMGVDDNSVVDGELKVRGVEGLRVIDASVMPTLVSGNTNAPTIAIAEKAADMIRNIAPPPPETPAAMKEMLG